MGRHMAWLSPWALVAFVTHKAVYYLVPATPYGLALVLVFMPSLAYALWCGAEAARSGRAGGDGSEL
eukprot:CAMPEP_0175782258 /NCGR_PEP_ID=MMETSP0097-20121207/77686_1 /TAXON_ID=311494 /ORGANISM="Alexandrium monilatum, Strain CCMP3105" /LENGTH=66 /DNA_ID=CAMNT_0017093065 /DNA_START=57 /DNA_END=253 /DNA_ORIENTATION=-